MDYDSRVNDGRLRQGLVRCGVWAPGCIASAFAFGLTGGFDSNAELVFFLIITASVCAATLVSVTVIPVFLTRHWKGVASMDKLLTALLALNLAAALILAVPLALGWMIMLVGRT